VAVVGLAGRYPGAADLAEFWANLEAARDCITDLTDEELRAVGVSEAELAHPAYVRRAALLDGFEMFDSAFFGYTPREADIKSPQQRVLLELAHQALEDAGCDPHRYPGRIGLFAGGNYNSYEWLNLYANPELIERIGEASIQIANDLDYLATSISYKLDLRGPSVNLQSACSTSLLAVHLAVRSLLAGECDMALAGGVAVRLPAVAGTPQRDGYLYQEGGIWSSDGRTHSFDARADGTVFGSGAGVVGLRPLRDALRRMKRG